MSCRRPIFVIVIFIVIVDQTGNVEHTPGHDRKWKKNVNKSGAFSTCSSPLTPRRRRPSPVIVFVIVLVIFLLFVYISYASICSPLFTPPRKKPSPATSREQAGQVGQVATC